MDSRISQLIAAQRLQEDIQAAERSRLAAAVKRPEPEPTARPRRFVRRRPRATTIPDR